MNRIRILGIYILISIFSMSAESAFLFTTTDKRISLLELYTSEGCSSCPPADRWLSELKEDSGLWEKFIPIAFHVDYWNYIGWNDRFSSSAYSERQRNYARSKNLKTVYTPGFILNGKEWRSFFGLRRLSPDYNQSVGKLSVSIEDKKMNAKYIPVNFNNDQLELNIAIIGFDLVTDVAAGENSGKQLKHDFAVLGYSSMTMNQSNLEYNVTVSLPVPAVVAPRYGVVAWVSEVNDQTPIQTVGGMLE